MASSPRVKSEGLLSPVHLFHPLHPQRLSCSRTSPTLRRGIEIQWLGTQVLAKVLGWLPCCQNPPQSAQS